MQLGVQLAIREASLYPVDSTTDLKDTFLVLCKAYSAYVTIIKNTTEAPEVPLGYVVNLIVSNVETAQSNFVVAFSKFQDSLFAASGYIAQTSASNKR